MLPSALLAFILLLTLTSASSFCNSTGCYDCFYRCSVCTGPLSSQCSSCTQNYLLTNSSCLPCTSNCLSCTNTQKGGCQTCASGFYLAQSTSTCSLCPQGAATCTFSAVQQCLSGYYLLNSVCFFCITNCLTCSNAYTCSRCQNGYYLTVQNTCQGCQVGNCASCTSDGSCSLCNAGYYGSSCNKTCPSNCDVCDQNTCYQCATTFAMGSSGECQPLGILCSSSSTFKACDQCLPGIAFAQGQGCTPYQYVHSTNQQNYYLPFNSPQTFPLAKLYFCASKNLYYSASANTITLNFTIAPSYLITITLQILAVYANQTVSIQLSSGNLNESPSYSLNTKSTQTCNNQPFIFSNLKANFTPKFNSSQTRYTLSLNITTSSQNLIGVSQLLIEQMPCGVSNCGICLTAYTCQQCLPNYYLQNNYCVDACSEGYYVTAAVQSCTLTCGLGYYPILADYQCQTCISPCATCSSSISCSSCMQSTFLLSSQCLSSCQIGYYADAATRVCLSCRYPCQSCLNSSTLCTSCAIGYLSGSACLITCPAGYFANLTTIACQQCLSPCLQCKIVGSQCTKCASNLYLQTNSTCLSSCDAGYVASDGICSKCGYPCLTCSNSTTNCSSCQAGYLSQYSCISVCPNTFYSDNAARICQKCQSPCLQCTTAIQCISCVANYSYYSANSTCLTNCPATTYSVMQICTNCPSPCNTCDSNGCLSCQGYLFILYNYTCRMTCPSGTYMALNNVSAKYCLPCGNYCSNCLAPTQCLTCYNNTVLLGGLCVSSCSQGYYPDEGKCSLCLTPCVNCLSSDLCVTCLLGYTFFASSASCLRICPNGYYAVNGSCVSCDSACAICNDSSKICLQCSRGYFKSLVSNVCLQTCEVGYYSYSLQRSCKKCSSPCEACSYGSVCLSCVVNSAYPLLHLHTCTAVCPSGYYSSNNSVCLACDSNCSTCLFTSKNCTSCQSSYLLFYDQSLGSCLSVCPSKFYQTASANCASCLQPCLSCRSPTYCQSCSDSSLFALNGKCVSSCLPGYYFLGTNTSIICGVCSQQCLSCSKLSTNCTACTPPKYLSKGQCLTACADGDYPDPLTSTCLSCPSPCSLCHTALKCKTCVSGYYLYFDLCLNVCPLGYYSSPTASQCLSCQSPCLTCKNSNICLSCISGYFLSQSNGSCLTTCQAGYYAFQTTSGDMQCFACSTSCSECYDATACKSCVFGSNLPYLQATTCQAQCTQGYYSVSNNFTCQSCGKWCITCYSFGNCTKCANAYLLQGSCTSECPSLYYASLVFTCERCSSPCLECANSANCLTCIPGYYLYLTHCLQHCPLDQWAINPINICNTTCSSPLYYIGSNRSCSYSCALYHSSERVCLSICNQGYIANQSFECQSCLNTDCTAMLYYQLVQSQLQGKLKIQLIFNYPLDNPQGIQITDFSVTAQSSNAPTQQETDLSAFRTLQQTTSPSYRVLSASLNTITIEVDSPAKDSCFSGNVKLSIANLSAFTSKGFPVQATDATLYIDWFQPSSQQKWCQVISYLIQIIFLLCLLINFAFDNTKVMVPLADVIQSIHFLFYLDVWLQPGLTQFMKGLNFAALRAKLFLSISDSSLWNCPIKSQLIYGGCSLYNEIVMPVATFGFLMGVNWILSKLKYFKKRDAMSWGNIYCFWWLCSSSFAVTSFSYLSKSTGNDFIVSCVCVSVFLLLSLALCFQVIKNVYNKSYAQRAFFWNIKRSAGELANLHPLLLMVRRLCLIMGVSLASSSPLGCLFIVTLLTVYVIANLILSKSVKKLLKVQVAAEILFDLFLVLLQMAIVNATKLGASAWNVLGWIIFTIGFLCIGLFIVLTVRETVSTLKKNIKKIRAAFSQNQEKAAVGDKTQKSNKKGSVGSKNNVEQAVVKEKKEILSPKEREDTQHQILRWSTSENKNRLSSDGFSDILQRDETKRAAPKLIKVLKQPKPQEIKDSNLE